MIVYHFVIGCTHFAMGCASFCVRVYPFCDRSNLFCDRVYLFCERVYPFVIGCTPFVMGRPPFEVGASSGECDHVTFASPRRPRLFEEADFIVCVKIHARKKLREVSELCVVDVW